jgi:3-methyladenine DNA glycosylase AlkD
VSNSSDDAPSKRTARDSELRGIRRHSSEFRKRSAAAAHRRLTALADPSRVQGLQRFFKTAPGEYAAGDRFLGIRVPVVRHLARACQDLPLREVERLLESPWHEARLLALLILVRQYQRGDATRRAAIYRCYTHNRHRINNWDLVDCSAEHIVGAHLRQTDRRFLRRLAASASVWDRRMAILATFHYIKTGEHDETLAIARLLLTDPDDLVQKAVGWMLREVGKRNPQVEKAFLHEHGASMPRTMLRYAIERFPEKVRRRYLAR